MPMMTSKILKFVDFTKTQKSRHVEKKTLFILEIKNFHITGSFMVKTSFPAEVTLRKELALTNLIIEYA